MSRPYYCTPADTSNEIYCLQTLVDRINRDSVRHGQNRVATFVHMGSESHFPYDGEIYFNGMLAAVVEVKSRTGDSTRYSEWHMAQFKINRNIAAAKGKSVPLFLTYRWDDGVFMAVASTLDLSKTHISGRTDRNDPHDVE